MPPEVRIILYTAFVICVYFIEDLAICWFVLGLLLIPILFVPFRILRRGWIPISLLLLFTFISNMLFQHGKVLFQAGPFMITDEGLSTASLRTMKFLFMIAGAKILTGTTTPDSLVGALSRLLGPLGRLGIPVDEFLQIMGLAMKSLPRIREEIVAGVDEKVSGGHGGGAFGRLKMISSQLVPVFISSMRTPERHFDEDSGSGDGHRGDVRKEDKRG